MVVMRQLRHGKIFQMIKLFPAALPPCRFIRLLTGLLGQTS